MFKRRNEADACECAAQHGLSYGFCVFDGFMYVGTQEQLERIGCINIKKPEAVQEGKSD